MKKTILMTMVLAIGLSTELAKADFTFGEPTNLGPNVNTASGEGGNGLSISADGLSIYFESDRSGGYGNADLWIATRATKNDDWSTPINLGSVVNGSAQDNSPSISADGLSLYFSSNRGGYGGVDLFVATRETIADDWGVPSNLGSVVNSSDGDYMSHISADGLSLYFSSERPGGLGLRDLWMTTRATTNDEWSEPVNLGPTVNSSSNERRMWISSDGLMLLLQSDRPKGSGVVDIYMTTRATTNDDWTEPVNIGPPVNVSIISDVSPVVSSDGCALYFASYARIGNYGAWDLWQAPIEPICDLNADGIVDAADMCIVVDNWSTDNKLCDVGPIPWGDGVVDVEDLVIIAEHLFEVYPSADTVDVHEADDGGQIELELGKLLVVTLESNPSTGYRWELIENNESILKQFGQAEFKPSETSNPRMVGAGGWEIFRFKAVNAGQTTLELVYHRSWEDVEPLKTFSIQVVVP